MKAICNRFLAISAVLFIAAASLCAQAFWQTDTIPGVHSAINVLSVNTKGDVYSATDGDGLFRSTDGGQSWARLDDPATMPSYYYSIGFNSKGWIYLGSYRGRGYRSTNNGASWDTFSIGNSTTVLTNFAFDTANGITFVATGGQGLFSAVDTLAKLDTLTKWNPAINEIDLPYISSLYIDHRKNMFAGTYGAGIYFSDRGVGLWEHDPAFRWDYRRHQWTWMIAPCNRVNGFAAGQNGRLFAATDAGVFRDSVQIDTVTTNPLRLDTLHAGWYQDTASAHSNLFVYNVAATAGGHVLAGTYAGGVMRSTDNGIRWSFVNTGLPATCNVTALVINASGYVFAGLSNGAIYRSASPEPMELPVHPPTQRLLSPVPRVEQNYPNPFNPATVIPFSLPHNGYATLIIYDALGREVTRLVEGMVSQGFHEVRWDAAQMPSGMYFYRFQCAQTSQTGKLMLVK